MSRDILLSLIDPDPEQPRKHFDPAVLDELAQAMAANGLAVPILVRPAGERFIIVHGERRYRAAQALGWETIPAEVRELAPDDAHWLALIENVQRADLSPIEEARAYRAHLDRGITQEALGQRIGKSQSYIAQKLRLLMLPDPLQLFLDRKALTEGHARQLLRLRGMYGDDLTWSCPPGSLDNATPEPLPPDRWVLSLTIALRIEDKAPACHPETPEEAQLLYDGCMAFRDYVAEHDYTIPLWALAAFYWSVVAIHGRLSVAILSQGLEQWYARFLSNLGWYLVEQPPQRNKLIRDMTMHEEMRYLLYWGIRADLRHGRILEYEQAHGDLPTALKETALEFILKHGGETALPSQLQPWGEKSSSERFQHLQAMTAE